MPLVNNFNESPQETASWCWAAASQMMLRRFLQSQTRQCELASSFAELMFSAKVDCCRDSGNQNCQQYGPLMVRGLRFDSTGLNNYMTWEQVKEEIDNNRPFVISSTIHYYIVIGYNDSQSQQLVLWNPWPPREGAYETQTMQWYRQLQNQQSYYNFRPA